MKANNEETEKRFENAEALFRATYKPVPACELIVGKLNKILNLQAELLTDYYEGRCELEKVNRLTPEYNAQRNILEELLGDLGYDN